MEYQRLIDIIQTLVSIRELPILMDEILKLMRQTVGCDAGSIFIYNEDEDALVFKYIQNDSVNVAYKEFTLSLSEESIAGYAGLHRKIVSESDVYNILKDKPYSFNSDFDTISGYRTKSVVAIPLLNIHQELIGVLQLINKKSKNVILAVENIDKFVVDFSLEDIRVLHSLSGIVAVALENGILYNNIEKMWDGFITASIQAIEARDPVTRGHTERVTKISLLIAQAMSQDNEYFKDFKMDSDSFQLLRYSCLLHDFGKIGVRENVLNKPTKLTADRLDVLIFKFLYAICLCKTKGGEEYSYLKNCYDILLKVNNSTLTPSEEKMLTSCKNYKLKGLDGKDIDLITENELEHLLIKKGTFTENERKEMESHVYHTYAYLNKIPWTKKLKDVPKIACMHHEKLDGTGYPFGLKDGDIHTYGKIMAIADIFDALTAKDRPYKKAVSVEKVLEILKLEAENNKLDRKIVDFFVQKRVFEKI